ncbi:BLUF domain-containing protein [Parvibaculum sp.]|uniref:BLUF domain-containing protein n=1 Tax=Parvibaculum sp. TaxID=2024848 RepID=UPI00391880E7
MIYQIAYMSAARPGMSDAEVHDILRASTANNRRDGLSGMLLLVDGTFFQVLEGEREMVEQTYRRILTDARHSALLRVLERNREERSFPDWTMGFEKVFHGDPGGEFLPVDAGDLTQNPNVELLRKQAPEIISFMRSLYASRNMRGAPDLERRA